MQPIQRADGRVGGPAKGEEVDFVLYGKRGLLAFEVKRGARPRAEDAKALRLFRTEFPEAKAHLVHTGTRRWHESGIDYVPASTAFGALDAML